MSYAESRVDAGGSVSLCCLRAGTGLYGIETTGIREVLGHVMPQRVPLAPEYIAGVVPYRGEVLTTVSFGVLLGLERNTGPGAVLVLEDAENEERFGLLVDGVGGVTTVARSSLEPNPSTLDARCLALFAGAYRTPSGLMVHLEPERLRPARLKTSGLLGTAISNRRRGPA